MTKILIIDDNEEILKTLEQLFQFYDYRVKTAINGKVGLEVIESYMPDLIILDALMPVMNGFETIREIKKVEKYKDIAVVFLSANYTDDDYKIAGLELGADDYLLKPFNTKELITKVKALLQRKYLIDNLKSANVELLKSHQRLKREVEVMKSAKTKEKSPFLDTETGIYNLEYFEPRLHEEVERSIRYKNELSLIIISLDNLQEINAHCDDTFISYLFMKTANTLLKATRTSDILCRISDKIFTVILPHTDEDGAFYEAERLRAIITRNDLFSNILDEIPGIRNRKIRKLEFYSSISVVQYNKNEKSS
ncbi:MAG: response regulator, partial [Calditrichia bacterium]|nr:response regulator [Calditrichia bacterium]